MDARTMMIIAKGKPISSEVDSYVFNDSTKKWDITFKNGKVFHYNYQNVVVLKESISLKPQDYQIRRGGKLFDNITAIFAFKGQRKEYWHICFAIGYENDYCVDDLEINKSVLNRAGAKQVFEYLREVADIISVHAEDGTSILSKQYEKIDFLSDDSAAAVYLDFGDYKAGTDLNTATPIFPFGCNESQYKAVCNALSNRISVIEGPPGTGKTQTILNIIANLVIQGKTVQVISNNNSAIDNVIEKMSAPKYGVDFIAAQLGREQRKEEFVANQSGIYPNLSAWETGRFDSQDSFAELLQRSLQLQGIFRDKNHLAELRQELYNVRLEHEHYKKLIGTKELIISKKHLSANQLMEYWQEYQDIGEGNKKVSLLYRITRYFAYGISTGKLMKEDSATAINHLRHLYYAEKEREIQAEIQAIEKKLESTDADTLMTEFVEMSLQCFHEKLASRYTYREKRKTFELDFLWRVPNEFLEEYPVVLSTTYTARSSLGKNAKFDYVIMDEASQVDVATGMLGLSCAQNAVIVGDTKQLPNVVTTQQKEQLTAIFRKHHVDDQYNFAEYSFLKSVCGLMGKRIPQVTLCEHYRCHPQIIEFCNQKFYDGGLLIMTERDDISALQLVTTVAGHHERDHMNQRQIDIIRTEILPNLNYAKSQIGIIAPYRNQVEQLAVELSEPEIDIATVHKFQGREKDVIILSTVDDTVTEFSDDPNLLNVAVSRAKKQLIIVAADQEQPLGSNVGDLIGYIRYHNCDISHSEISSVFDYLYSQYADYRMEYLKKHRRISEYDSENLMYALIQEELEQRNDSALHIICHQPLQLLLRDQSRLSAEEQRFVNTGLSHLDFLIYNKISKRPVLAIEVDGFHYHKDGTKQVERDKLKNHILAVYGLPLLRFSTNGSQEREKLKSKLDSIYEKTVYSPDVFRKIMEQVENFEENS